jgi:hypothetical protein
MWVRLAGRRLRLVLLGGRASVECKRMSEKGGEGHGGMERK